MPLICALIKTLNIRKIFTWLKAQRSFILARYFNKVVLNTYTPFVSIEATNRCMLKCPECVCGSQELTREIGNMSLNDFKKIIDEIYKHTIVLNLYMQGEPYMNKDLGQMIAYAKKKNIFVSISSNAQIIPTFKKEELPHHLIISADGAKQETYEKYRVGGSLQKVKDFTKGLSDFKQKNNTPLPYVELQFLENNYNKDEAEATKLLFSGSYNRFVKKKMQIIHPETGTHFSTPNACCNRHVNTSTNSASCYKMLSTTVVTQDGSIVPCCMDKNAQFSYANIKETKIATANKSKESRDFQKLIISKKNKVSICQNCPFA